MVPQLSLSLVILGVVSGTEYIGEECEVEVASSESVSLLQVRDASLGGFYTDPKYYKPGTFAGTRMVSDATNGIESARLIIIGSDDGATFWTLFGNVLKADAVINLLPIGGSNNSKAKFTSNKLEFEDGSSWTKLVKQDATTMVRYALFTDFGGFYVDPNYYVEGTFAGTCMVSDISGTGAGDAITIVGSYNGVEFWTANGIFSDKQAGKLSVDFSCNDQSTTLTGEYTDGQVVWEDGNIWKRLETPPLA